MVAVGAEIYTAPARITEGQAELTGGRIYYRDTGGNGPVVVFLHAGSGNCLLFEKQIAPLVAGGYRVISYDRAGHGRSTRALGTNEAKALSIPHIPEVEQLMDWLKISRFHLVGVAAGGGVALKYALTYPRRVMSLVLANSLGDMQDASYAEIGRRLRPPAFNQLPLELRELGPSYRAANPEGVQRWLELSQASVRAPENASTPTSAGSCDIISTRGPSPSPSDIAVTFAKLETNTEGLREGKPTMTGVHDHVIERIIRVGC